MSLRVCDGFDSYNVGSGGGASVGPMKWSATEGASVEGVRAGGLAIQSTGSGGYVEKYLEPALEDFVLGWRLFLPVPTAQYGILRLTDADYFAPATVLRLNLDLLGNLIAVSRDDYWGTEVELFRTSSAAVQWGAYNYLEVKRVGTAWTIRVNGNTVAMGTGPSTTIGCVRIDLGSNSLQKLDDTYLLDIDSETPNDFLGDVAVVPIELTDDFLAEWTRKSGAKNVEMIQETPPDEDETYNSTTEVDKTDLFIPDPATALDPTLTVYGVQLTVRMEKVNTASINGQPVMRSGTESGAMEAVGDSVGLPIGYTYFVLPKGLDPSGAPWTVASVLAGVYGYRSKAPV